MARHVILWLGAVLLALVVVPALVISKVEEQDTFCRACHRPAEETFVARALTARAGEDAAVDLASGHAPAGVRCVDCHRGDQSPGHRIVSLALGARNTVIFLLGQDDGDTLNVRGRPEASCRACHGDVLAQEGFEKHFHNLLPEFEALPAVQADPTNAVLCVDCHPAHVEAEPLLGFVEEVQVLPQCEKCHTVWGRGPRGLGK